MMVTDQKISEMIPKTCSVETCTGCGSLGLKTVCTVYSGLVPMSPKTTPSAPTVRAAWPVTCRVVVTVLPPSSPDLPGRYLNERSTQHSFPAIPGESAVGLAAASGSG